MNLKYFSSPLTCLCTSINQKRMYYIGYIINTEPADPICQNIKYLDTIIIYTALKAKYMYKNDKK